MKKHVLSKSTFLRAVQCSKSLYLNQYYKKLREPPSADRQALLNRGQEVGGLAWQCFPEGVDARTGNRFHYGKAVENTHNLIQQGATTIFEATFQQEQVLVMVDVLTRRNGYWEALEVKSSARVSQHHIRDAALQLYVLGQAGINVSDFSIMHINKGYVRNGALAINGLFTQDSVFKDASELQSWVSEMVAHGKAVLQKPTVPKVPIGKHCTNPYPCDFINYCWQNIPEDSIFELGHLSADSKFQWYEEGYSTIADLNPDEQDNRTIAIQVRSHQRMEPYIEHEALQEFIEGFRYPLTFMDFEAIMPAIPVFNGTRPFQKMAFQYSLHHLKEVQGTLSYKDWVLEPGHLPHADFLEHFLADTEGAAHLVVFEETLERQILELTKQQFPAYKNDLQDRLDRIRDLRYPFKHMHYYHPAMRGNFSLQGIYEALFGKDQTERAIEDGGIASIRYEQLLMGNREPSEKAEQLEQLRAYCAQDTLALARIFSFLEKQVKSFTP